MWSSFYVYNAFVITNGQCTSMKRGKEHLSQMNIIIRLSIRRLIKVASCTSYIPRNRVIFRLNPKILALNATF